MQKKTRNILSYAFWLVLAVVLVWLSLRSVDWKQFGEALSQCNWAWIAVGFCAALVVFYVRALRWRMQLLPFDSRSSIRTSFNAYNICMVVNLILPRVGEVVRCGYVVRRSSVDENGKRRITLDKALGTMLVDRVWDILSLLIVALLVAFSMWDKSGSFFQDSLFSALLGKVNVLWIVLGVLVICGAAVYLAWRFREKNKFWAKVWDIVKGMRDGVLSCLHMRNGWLFIVYTVLIWALYWFMCVCAVKAVSGIEAFSVLHPSDALLIMFAGSVSSIIPVPGGFGAYHAVVSGVLSAVWGIPFGTAMIFATLTHETQVIATAVAGIWSYLDESFFRKKKSC